MSAKLKSSTIKKPPGALPNWLTAFILILVLAGAGWGGWWYFEGNNQSAASGAAVLSDANVVGPSVRGDRRDRPRSPNFLQFAQRLAANMPDGIMPTGNGYLVKSGTARLDVDGNAKGNNSAGEWRYRFSYAIADLVPPDEMAILRVERRTLMDSASAEKLGVTADQIQQLRTVPNAGMFVEAADRLKIGSLFHAWLVAAGRPLNAATRPAALPPASPEAKAAEQQLLAALSDLGKRQLDPTKKAYAARIAQIRGILGDGLLQKLKQPA